MVIYYFVKDKFFNKRWSPDAALVIRKRQQLVEYLNNCRKKQ